MEYIMYDEHGNEINKNIPKVYIKFVKLIIWGSNNLTEKEKDMIYLFENFNRVYLTKQEIKFGKEVSLYYFNQIERIDKIIKKYNITIDFD